MESENLDDILESALEDFEQQEKDAETQNEETQKETKISQNSEDHVEELRKMMEGLAHGDFNKTFEEIVKNMGEEDMQFDKDTEDNIKKLLQEVENNPDMANIMEGMMQSLISKDILYEPIKEMKDKYEPWLKENEKTLSKEDFNKYKEQLNIITEICTIYEANSEDTPKLLSLIQQIQETGQLPSAILHDLAPELTNDNCSLM